MRILFLLLLSSTVSFSANYYVSPKGDNTNDGSLVAPFLTISYGVSSLTAGDTLFIKEGVYKERVEVTVSGTESNHIVITNFEDDSVVIDGSQSDWGDRWYGLFTIANQGYLIVNGISVIRSVTYGGIWVEESHHITIQNCSTYDTYSSGISCWNSDSVTFTHNEVELACNPGEQESISVESSSNVIVSFNEVHHNGGGENGGEGIDIKNGSHDVKVFNNYVHHLVERIGLYGDAWDSHTYAIEYYNNIVHDCGNNGINIQSEMGGLIENIKIYNNVVYNNKWDGIVVGSVVADPSVDTTPVENVAIYNNTVYGNGTSSDGSFSGGWGYGILIDNPDARTIVVRNNILSGNSAQLALNGTPQSEVLFEYNLLDGFNETPESVDGMHALKATPHFKDTAAHDFNLTNISPAIDAAIETDVPLTDILGTSRPVGLGGDMGAYEFDSTITPLTKTTIQNSSAPYQIVQRGRHIVVHFVQPLRSDYSFTLFSITGKVVASSQGSRGQDIYITSPLAQGVYLFSLHTEGGLQTLKGRFRVS